MAKTALAICLITGLVSACRLGPAASADLEQNQASVSAVLGEAFWLDYGEMAVLDNANLRVLFEGLVEDSRCPTDVVCVWEGRGRISIEVSIQSDPASSIELAIPGGDAGPSPSVPAARLPPYEFGLRELLPYPVSDSALAVEDYSALLTIERLP